MSCKSKIFLNHCPCIFIYQSVLVLSQWCCVLFFRCRRRCFQWPFSLGSSDERINASIYLHVGSPSASTPAKAKREAHNQAPNGFSFTMVLPESFDLILLSSLLVTLDSPFLELLYVLGYEGLNNPKKIIKSEVCHTLASRSHEAVMYVEQHCYSEH